MSNRELAIFQNEMFMQNIYSHLTRLSDVLAFSATCQDAELAGMNVVPQQFAAVVEPFVGSRVAHLCHVMHVTNTVTTGSCTLKLWLGDETTPNDMNLIMADTRTGGHSLYSFIVDTLQYICISNNTELNYAYEGIVRGFAKYQRHNRFITVSQTCADGMFKAITASPTMADTICMTPGRVAVLYLQWTLHGIAVTNHTLVHTAIENVGCFQQAHWDVQRTTDFLNRPCGSLCPAVWRDVADNSEQILVLEWDSRFSMKSILNRSGTIWHLALDCQNSACPFNPNVNARSAHLPANPVPGTHLTIGIQEERIEHHRPHYEAKYKGILYAMNCWMPQIVSVPLRDGVPVPGHVSRLQVWHWVDMLGPEQFVHVSA
ncbi:hypothetical protein F4604DRAFT_1919777 [Suillus subluteus]|nr:hypothetical protein F4604DRAFT_1919777 [Suillus subluteus]